jgi:ParB family chromosome partitioning protein
MLLDNFAGLALVFLPLCLLCVGAVVLPPVKDIPTRRCFPDPNNQRKVYELKLLRASIDQHGILQPIGVRWDAAKLCFFAMWGNSRLLCALDLGLETVPARVWERELSRLEIARFQTTENLARSDLRPSERAASFRELLQLESLTAAAFAEQWGTSAATVSRHLMLLEQPPDIIALVDAGTVSLSTVAAVARLPDDDSKREMIAQIRDGCLPRHKVEEAVQAMVGKRDSKSKISKLSFKNGAAGVSVTGEGLTVELAARALNGLLKQVRNAMERGQSLEALSQALKKGGG